jgi:macrolide transport system ATP-binding/permease protein
MNAFVRFSRKMELLLRRRRFSSELEEEMAFHREQVEKELKSGGMEANAAQHAARRQFGNQTRLNEQSHEMVGFRFENAARDLHFALRQWRKNPGFALTAILILALGIGASVAIFSFVDAALIQPLPYRNPSHLVGIFETTPLGPRFHLSYLDYLDWKKFNKVFSSLEAYDDTSFLLNTVTGVQQVDGATVSDGFFRALGVAPVLGRDFRNGEDLPGAPRTILLSYAAWQNRYGGRADVLGQAVTLGGAPNTIIGVLPQGFHFAPAGPAEFWATLHSSRAEDRGEHGLSGIARLKDGVSLQAAAADMSSIAAQLARQYPDADGDRGATVLPLTEVIVGSFRPILLVLLSGAVLLLLIACVNVASLLLVRSESRKREIAVRGALGASRARLVRQFITEGLLLVGMGSVLGIASALAAMQLLIRLIPVSMLSSMPYLQGLSLNGRVMAFACGISLIAALLFSLVPILRLPLQDMRDGLTDGGRTSAGTVWRRFGANLVVIEMAIAMVLLVGAGLLGKSFYRLLHTDIGMQPDHLAAMRVLAPGPGYAKDEQMVALARQVVDRIASLPGVKSVALSHGLPVGSGSGNTTFQVIGRPDTRTSNYVDNRQVSSDYFTTLQARLMRGRFFTAAEDATKPRVAIINQAMAQRYFPGEDPVGKRIVYDVSAPQMEIVGIVDNVKEGPLDEDTHATMYVPIDQEPDRRFYVIVRTSKAEESLLPVLAAAIHQVDSALMISGEETMTGRIHNSPSAYLHRSSAWLVGGFAAIALLLSVVGLYGVVAYSVSRRTREIGVRMALGARRSSVYRLVLGEAGWLTAMGIAAGLALSIAAALLMRKLLFGVRAWDVSTLIGVAVVLAFAALAASYLPARRAASINPVEALRAE